MCIYIAIVIPLLNIIHPAPFAWSTDGNGVLVELCLSEQKRSCPTSIIRSITTYIADASTSCFRCLLPIFSSLPRVTTFPPFFQTDAAWSFSFSVHVWVCVCVKVIGARWWERVFSPLGSQLHRTCCVLFLSLGCYVFFSRSFMFFAIWSFGLSFVFVCFVSVVVTFMFKLSTNFQAIIFNNNNAKVCFVFPFFSLLLLCFTLRPFASFDYLFIYLLCLLRSKYTFYSSRGGSFATVDYVCVGFFFC